jgi:hypothetical protein
MRLWKLIAPLIGAFLLFASPAHAQQPAGAASRSNVQSVAVQDFFNNTTGLVTPSILLGYEQLVSTSYVNWVTDTGTTGTVFCLVSANCVISGAWSFATVPTIPIGSSLTNNGSTLSCTTATLAQLGCVRPDGSTITISVGGTITANTGAAASVTVGTTTVGSGTNTNCLYDNAGILGNEPCVTSLTAGIGLTTTQGSTNAGPITATGSLFADASYLEGYLGGVTLSNDATTPNSVIDIAKGVVASDDTTQLMKIAAFTKTTAGTWVVGSGNAGLDVGGVLASTWYNVYMIMRTDTNVVDVLLAQSPGITGVSITCTSASPAVCTWGGASPLALPFQNGATFQFTAGTAPTGFTLNTVYFVVASSQAAGTFELSATQGGSAINSTSTGTSLVGQSIPQLPASYSVKRRIGSIKTDGSSHILAFTQNGDEFLWGVPTVDVSVVAIATTAVLEIMNVPIGVKTNDKILLSSIAGANISLITLISSLDVADTTPVFEGVGLSQESQASGAQNAATAELSVRVNTSQQLRARANNASNATTLVTQGWIDTRGRFN